MWELADEFGFLANAEYLAGHNWPHMITSYYGYGYSLALIPLFYLCKTSVQLLQGVVIVNIICILLIYVISLTLMCKLCDFIHKNVLALIAALLCLYPYLAANTLKVTCECFLTMLTWLVWLLLYQALETKKKRYFILLGIAVPYAFFTHTRGLVLTITVFLIFLILCIRKHMKLNSFLIFGAVLILSYGAGFLLKNDIVAHVYTPDISIDTDGTGAVVNLINLEWILTRVEWFFADFKFYVYAFLCKNVYLFVASLGLCHLGIFAGIRNLWYAHKEKKSFSASDWVKFSIVLSFILMIGMILAAGAGILENVAYFYYGRYFEYLVCPLIFLGIAHCVAEGLEEKQFFKWFVFWGVCALGGMQLSNYLKSQVMSIDTNRIAAFSFVTKEVNQYPEVLEYLILYGSLGIFLIFLLCRKKETRKFILVPLIILFLVNDSATIQQITYINERDSGDNYIADYLIENVSDDDVFFVNTKYLYDRFYMRMQVLLGDKRLRVVEVEDVETIPAGAYFVAYNNDSTEAQLAPVAETVMPGRAFKLYQKQ